ncbi:hypothetical protein MNEG_16815 (mitochondrion) [Monoraphidium neglectum]|jgi:quinol-cytochrome oxidoreductase complex cytochrome b subunit|uniref:Cytochrome b n=1 Tax=Monoraphidium neglectum TaxID=145388 RepID=A0A0D2KD06_9CHLO|nr:hypothetical protein MNEG_16815 [Monoraphidium neglectum]KIZ07958.1 hypothetical protein MNEG_16815 [Monoraphidium neglectum]|eukprot:XP_013906977.1 hypothetical protein MNEG_16815 (mitochondrion) [Monoraphidium neglectum]
MSSILTLVWVYAILRSIPNKLAGVAAIGLVFVSLALLPYLHKPTSRSPLFRPVHKALAWALIGDFLLLTYLGHQPVEPPFVALGQLATALFFGLLLAFCFAAWLDQWLAGIFEPSIKDDLGAEGPKTVGA